MTKKIVAAVAALLALSTIGVVVWGRAILGTDTVRTAIEAQASKAMGQPVTIGGIGASIFPRVSIELDKVAIGQPPRIQVATLQVGTSFGALFSRRIENATLHLTGARIELPLPPLGSGSPSVPASPAPPGRPAPSGRPAPPASSPAPPAAEETSMPVEIISVDEILLTDVEIVSGGRTLRGNIDAALEGETLVLRAVELKAEEATITATGRLSNLSAPTGELNVKAGALNVDHLLAFAGDFAGGSAAPPAKPARSPAPRAAASRTPAPQMNVALTLDADRATMGGMTIETLTGRAQITSNAVTIDPMAFGLFGGRYEGKLDVRLPTSGTKGEPSFQWNAALSGIDVAAATAYAGAPNTISGRLAGTIDLTGTGADAATAIKTVRGTARIDIVDGVVKNLGLVRNVVIATSMRGDYARRAVSSTTTDEPFTRLAATLRIGNGAAASDDLRFEAKDLSLDAKGTVRLDASDVNLSGMLQLSEELSAQAGTDLARYTSDQGRVTLLANITGPATNPSVRLDVVDMARRAITNRATEEVQKQLKSGLGGLIRRP
jgi:uncharacterized protein involved in outer membrane biogenesis